MDTIQVTDLVAAIATREAQVVKLEEEIKALRTAHEILTSQNGALPKVTTVTKHDVTTPQDIKVRKRGKLKWGVSIGDAAAAIIAEAGPLRVEVIRQKLSEQGISTSLPSVDAALRKDRQKRFKLRGPRTYGLRIRRQLTEQVTEQVMPE